MFLTKKAWSAELADPQQRGRGRDISGRAIAQMTVFFVSWFVTYNKAYLAGDDINTFKGSGYGVSIFLPRLKPDWIPNRVVDMYGRNLLVHIFDLIYFPAKSLFGADFFFVFKIFNATLFAIFLCFVCRYLMGQVFAQGRSLREGAQKHEGDVLPSLFVAFVTLTILPWSNEVQMVCYQIPAFLGFVVLAELFKLMPRISGQVQGDVPAIQAPWLMTLAFIAAFSLEAYSAILLAAIVFAWVLNGQWRSKAVWRGQAFIMSCFLMGFCVAALFVTELYAQRPTAIEKLSPIKQIETFVFANKLLPHDVKLFCGCLVVGVVAPLLIVAFRPLCRRFVQGNATVMGWIAPVLQRFSLMRWGVFLFIVLFPTMIVVSLTSLETGDNYFSLNLYPWGGLLLIAAFFAVPAITMPTIWFFEGNFIADTIRIFLMMLFISGAAIHATRDSSQYYDNSVKVLNAYRAAQANSTAVFDTGLSLDSIPLQMRPLPTAHSLSRFVGDYPPFFKKYYDVNAAILFK